YYGSTQIAQYRQCIGNETHSNYVANAGLNSNQTLAAGSPAISAGTNLTSICSGQPVPGLGALCSDKTGVARPASGSWDAGAYQSKEPSGTPPVITSAGTASGTVGVAFTYQITATNGPTSFGASPLPAGLSVNTANGVIS